MGDGRYTDALWEARYSELVSLTDRLRNAALGDPGWEEFADLLMRPEYAGVLRQALAERELARDTSALQREAERVANYLGEGLRYLNFSPYDPTVNVGPRPPEVLRDVRPCGARHGSSGAPHGRDGGTLLDTRLSDTEDVLLPIVARTLKEGARGLDRHVRVRGGATLRSVNAALAERGKALENLPAYMGMTVGGALNVSAHGSGAHLGPLCDLVVSVTLRVADGTRRCIERGGDASVFDRTEWEKEYQPCALVQDDNTFYAAVVGVGCMGVVEEAMLRVVDAFWLTEVHELTSWSVAKRRLLGKEFMRPRHYEVLVSPYQRGGGEDPPCVILTRQPARTPPGPLPRYRRPDAFLDLVFVVVGVAFPVLLRSFPGLAPVFARRIVEAYTTPPDAVHEGEVGKLYGGLSHAVLDLGSSNRTKGVATEIAFVMKGGDATSVVEAVDAIIARAATQLPTHDGWTHTLPISLRFSSTTPHYLAMQYGGDGDVVCTVEMLALRDAPRYDVALGLYQRDALTRAGRPHWGQRNDLMAGVVDAGAYPRIDAWRAIRATHDPHDRFGNDMTASFSLTPRAQFAPPVAPAPTVPGSPWLEDRKKLPWDRERAKHCSDRYLIEACTARQFAQALLKVKSTCETFGPLELIRAEENRGKTFTLHERFEGRTRLDARLRAEVDHARLPGCLGGALDDALGCWAVRVVASRVADRLTSNYCVVTRLDGAELLGGATACEYEFLEGSPAAGGDRVGATDEGGACRLVHTLHYETTDPVRRWFMESIGERLAQVVAYLEVKAAAEALGKKFTTSVTKPTEAEACEPRHPPRVSPVDDRNVVAFKQDVRRFTVRAEAARFSATFHEVLSNQGDFGFFRVIRDNTGELFKKGDTFTGVFRMTPELQADILSLKLPVRHGGILGHLAGPALKHLLVRYLELDPPRDRGKITDLSPDRAPTRVRYDYLEGTLLAGHSTFTVEPLGDDICRVTQTCAYQERDLVTVATFGSIGLHLHNRVVEREIAVAAARLGATWERVEL